MNTLYGVPNQSALLWTRHRLPHSVAGQYVVMCVFLVGHGQNCDQSHSSSAFFTVTTVRSSNLTHAFKVYSCNSLRLGIRICSTTILAHQFNSRFHNNLIDVEVPVTQPDIINQWCTSIYFSKYVGLAVHHAANSIFTAHSTWIYLLIIAVWIKKFCIMSSCPSHESWFSCLSP
jgi:hypothetical protein